MSKLDELIKELCPNGVEYKTLGEVCEIARGASPRPIHNYLTTAENGIPWIKIGDVEVSSKYVEKTAEFVTKEGAEKSRFVKKGDFILSNSMSFGRPYILKIDGCIHDGWIFMRNYKKYFLTDFLYYLLRSNKVQHDWRQRASSGTVSNLNSDIVKATQIPVPPLPVQKEIVRILDKFTELTARRKQYEYYRDALLTRERSETKWKELQEIAEIGTGSCNTNEAEENGTYPFYVRSPEVLRKNTFEYDETAIITAGDGVGVGKVFHYVEGKYALHQRAYRIHITDKTVLPRYYFHYMKATFLNYISKEQFKASVQSIRRPMLNKYPVPIPPFDVQERIVNVLDNFDAICSDLKIGLPAEIDARKKQYEYYRDLLLTFAERGNTIFTEQNRTEQMK